MAHRGYRDASRVNWGQDDSESLKLEQINTGALLRIADATELMAKRYSELIAQRDQFERSANYWRDQFVAQERSTRALKGQVTKLKRAIATTKGQQQ